MKEKLYLKFAEEQNIRKVNESLNIFVTTPDEVEKYGKMMQSYSYDNCVHCYNIKV